MVLEATGFLTKRDSNQPPQLLAIKLKISCMASLGMFIIVNNKGSDQSAQMHMYEHSQSSRKRRTTRIGTHVFSLGRMIFARRESCVRMFFFKSARAKNPVAAR